MSRIDAFLPPPDELTAASRRVDAANQRDNWLRQMELAQMGQMGGTALPEAPAPRPAAAVLAQTPMHAAMHPAGADEDVAGDQPANAGQAAAASGAQADGDADAGRTEGAASAATDASTPAQAALAAAGLPAAMPAQAVTGDDPGVAAPAMQAGIAFAPAMLAGAQPGAFGSPPPAAPLAVGLAAALRTQTPVSATASESADAPAGGTDTTGETPDWQKRMMHLTGDGDDVKLWIRDGELSPAQSQQLVARLAADVAAMGLRLREATVNGKPALRGARDAAADEDTPDHTAIPEPITHPTTER